MSAQQKKVQHLARELFKVSLAEGRVAPERVTGVLAYLEKHPPEHALAVLKTYHRLIAQEVSKSQAVVEYAGQVGATVLQSIAAAMTQRYHRPITTVGQPNPELIAGVRVRVGDDVYESSIAGHLAGLAAKV